jgi:hypothetical protein
VFFIFLSLPLHCALLPFPSPSDAFQPLKLPSHFWNGELGITHAYFLCLMFPGPRPGLFRPTMPLHVKAASTIYTHKPPPHFSISSLPLTVIETLYTLSSFHRRTIPSHTPHSPTYYTHICTHVDMYLNVYFLIFKLRPQRASPPSIDPQFTAA